MIASFARFAQNALDLGQEQIELLTDDFLPAGIDFARRARQFDPAISREDTIQACRNAWTACGLQPLLGVPSGITPSIFGYSLLYPYSDNYLDSEKVPTRPSSPSASAFANACGARRFGVNPREAAVWALVATIEEQYPRARFPGSSIVCSPSIRRRRTVLPSSTADRIDDAEILRLSLRERRHVGVGRCLSGPWPDDRRGKRSRL